MAYTKEQQRGYQQANQERHAINKIKRLYKVPLESAVQLYRRSMGTCDCCNIQWSPALYKYRFCVDHNHGTGEVRGILCMDCNTSLGKLKDSTAIILALAAYNERYNGNK